MVKIRLSTGYQLLGNPAHDCAKVTAAAIKRYFHLSVIILVMFSTLPVFAAMEMFMGMDSC